MGPLLNPHPSPRVDDIRALLTLRPRSAEELADAIGCRLDAVRVILHGWPEFSSVVNDWSTTWFCAPPPAPPQAREGDPFGAALFVLGMALCWALVALVWMAARG